MRPPRLLAPLAALVTGLALVPHADATHGSLPPIHAALPCSDLAAALQPLGLDPVERRWHLQLTGVSDQLGPYSMDLHSDYRDLLPANWLAILGDAFAHLRGTLTTAEATYDVDLVWIWEDGSLVDAVTGVMLFTGQFVSARFVGEATGAGETVPIEIRNFFATAPLVCAADAHAFNWMELCWGDPGQGPPCIPAGWEVNGGLEAYYEGATAYTGSIGSGSTTGVGTAHGTTSLLWFWTAVP